MSSMERKTTTKRNIIKAGTFQSNEIGSHKGSPHAKPFVATGWVVHVWRVSNIDLFEKRSDELVRPTNAKRLSWRKCTSRTWITDWCWFMPLYLQYEIRSQSERCMRVVCVANLLPENRATKYGCLRSSWSVSISICNFESDSVAVQWCFSNGAIFGEHAECCGWLNRVTLTPLWFCDVPPLHIPWVDWGVRTVADIESPLVPLIFWVKVK